MDQKSNINVTVENYFAMWNARDARTRRTLVEEVWTEQARSVDPIAEVVGWDAIDQYVAGEQQKYPGHTVVRTGAPDQHHDRLRYPWALKGPKGETRLYGIDYVKVASDGRFIELVGFFDGGVPAAS